MSGQRQGGPLRVKLSLKIRIMNLSFCSIFKNNFKELASYLTSLFLAFSTITDEGRGVSLSGPKFVVGGV